MLRITRESITLCWLSASACNKGAVMLIIGPLACVEDDPDVQHAEQCTQVIVDGRVTRICRRDVDDWTRPIKR